MLTTLGFLYENTIPQFLTSIFVSIMAVFFLREEYFDWVRSFMFIVIPGLFGMFFKDIMFVSVYLLETGTIGGIRTTNGKAAFVHSLFEGYASFLSVPLSFVIVLGIMHVCRRWVKDDYPENWMTVMFWVVFANVTLGVFILDPIGF